MTHEDCKCHGKHKEAIETLKREEKENREDHLLMFNKIDKKLDSKWLIAGIALFIFWMTFQLTMFSKISSIETNVAVISEKVANIGS